MARHTADALVHVDAVVEINKAGQVMYPRPLNRPVGSKTLPDRFQHGAVGPDLGVALHARLCRRKTREGTLLDRGMTIATVDADAAHMVFMAEWHGLCAHHTGL